MTSHGKLRSGAVHSTKGDLSIIQKREREKRTCRNWLTCIARPTLNQFLSQAACCLLLLREIHFAFLWLLFQWENCWQVWEHLSTLSIIRLSFWHYIFIMAYFITNRTERKVCTSHSSLPNIFSLVACKIRCDSILRHPSYKGIDHQSKWKESWLSSLGNDRYNNNKKATEVLHFVFYFEYGNINFYFCLLKVEFLWKQSNSYIVIG